MKIINKPLAEIHPYENNPRINDGAIAAVTNSIREFGFRVPIIISADNEIIAGHTRYAAANALNFDVVPCIVAEDLSPEKIRAFRVVDNKTAELSEWDNAALAREIDELIAAGIDLSEYGFDVGEFDIDMDTLGDSFTLPEGDKANVEQMTFTFSGEQAELVRHALAAVDEPAETFGNVNEKGNKLYEVVRQWAQLKSLS